MEDLFHLCPPLAFFTRWKWILHGFHNCPPLLRLLVCSHLGPIRFYIFAMIFEIIKQIIIFEVNRIVPDITLAQCRDYFWPYGSMISLVRLYRFELQTQDHADSLHFGRPLFIERSSFCFGNEPVY